MTKRKNKRNRKKYPAIDPSVNLKTRYEEIMDVASYFHTLPEDAKEYLHSFVEEYINARFNHPGKKIYRRQEDKRKIYSRNNARNRDILTRAKASGNYVDEPSIKKRSNCFSLFSKDETAMPHKSTEDLNADTIDMENFIIAKIDYDIQLEENQLKPRKKIKKFNSRS